MKFGKDLKRQKVPEWTNAYVDYNGLKKILHEIPKSERTIPSTNLSKLSLKRSIWSLHFDGLTARSRNHDSSNDVENQVIDIQMVPRDDSRRLYSTRLLLSPEEADDSERKFFEKLDGELNKVNGFYRDKVEEVITEAGSLQKQIEALIALRIELMNPDSDGSNSMERAMSPDELENAAEVDLSRQDQQPANIPSSENRVRDSRNEGGNVDAHERFRLEILDRVKISSLHDTPISAIRGVFKDSRRKEAACNKEELKQAENRLKAAVIEFYQKLCLLKHYSFMNLSAFSKILKKYEKITSRKVAKSYMKIVENSHIGSSDETTNLIQRVEEVFVRNFMDSDRRKGMKLLRPKRKIERHHITFFSGFLSGCSISLLVVVALLIGDRKLMQKKGATLYMDIIFPLYSFYLYIVLHMLVYAANIYFWRLYKINYPFIFGFKQGTELGYREVFLLSNGVAVMALGTLLVHLHSKTDSKTQHYETYIELLPLCLIIVLLAITFCPFNVIFRSSRYFLVKCVFRCTSAPLYKVTLPDFFLADQLTSQIQALRSFEYYICFYGWGRLLQRTSKCNNTKNAYTVFYFVVGVVPYWFRFLQCVRRLLEEKDSSHVYNGFRYFFTIVAVIIRTTLELRNTVTWKVLAVVSSAVAAIANTYWDIVVDWGLLQRKSNNLFLRDKLVVSRKYVYFAAMVLDIVLRFAWLQIVLILDVHSLRGKTISMIFSCLEILRRGLWNFFRLENEHLNNVGKYRAFKSVPLPFTYYDDEQDQDGDDVNNKDD